MDNHARLTFTSSSSATFNLSKASNVTAYMQLWYTGSVPATVKLTLASDGTVVTAPPGGFDSKNGVTIQQFNPGQQFYPWKSSGPDRAVLAGLAVCMPTMRAGTAM